MQIVLANPRGFCAGVDRAISIVDRALDLFGSPIYVRHEIVHNRSVIDDFLKRGVIFTDDIATIPVGSVVIFSAHGVSQSVQDAAKARKLRVFDATCPLVTKVHMAVARCSRQGRECILVGHAGHPEVAGTMGQYQNRAGGIYLVETLACVRKLRVKDPLNLTYVTQTTLSVDDTRDIIRALQQKFPTIKGPKRDDICYATQNRQRAVKQLAQQADIVLVVGSENSSNANRLKELAHLVCPAYLVDDPKQLQVAWFEKKSVIGMTASASTPAALVQKIIQAIKQRFCIASVQALPGAAEDMVFTLPRMLRGVPINTEKQYADLRDPETDS